MSKILLNKNILELQKVNFNIHAKKILYMVLEAKKNELINSDIYDYEGKICYDKIDDLYDEYVEVNLSMLRKIFKGRKTFKQMYTFILNVPYMVKYNSYYDEFGNYLKNPLFRAITIFTDIIIDEDNKVIQFKLYDNFVKNIFPINNFTNINIDLILSLKTDFQIRLYEYISEFNYYDLNGNKIIKDEARKMKAEKFKSYFGINNNYSSYDMYSKLFLPAIEGLNNNELFGKKIIFNKFRLDDQDKKKISHYRIDVE